MSLGLRPLLIAILVMHVFVSVQAQVPSNGALQQTTTTKPLSNADVVAMVKGGLEESTIVLAIEQSSTPFRDVT